MDEYVVEIKNSDGHKAQRTLHASSEAEALIDARVIAQHVPIKGSVGGEVTRVWKKIFVSENP